jgi:hypothetical protein
MGAARVGETTFKMATVVGSVSVRAPSRTFAPAHALPRRLRLLPKLLGDPAPREPASPEPRESDGPALRLKNGPPPTMTMPTNASREAATHGKWLPGVASCDGHRSGAADASAKKIGDEREPSRRDRVYPCVQPARDADEKERKSSAPRRLPGRQGNRSTETTMTQSQWHMNLTRKPLEGRSKPSSCRRGYRLRQ